MKKKVNLREGGERDFKKLTINNVVRSTDNILLVEDFNLVMVHSS